ncbi:MAG TPA: HK97 family phage prohead protease [Longimicrobiales bacterium]|nr:HK97 family phage prohead protease [Longimicrobiales bacterium]
MTAVVSSLGVVDRDSDLVLPGSLSTRSAYVSEWNHSAMKGDAPVGSAILHEDGNRLIARVTFDDTPRGRRACQRVFDERPDWSVGYDIVKDREPTAEERERGVRRVIELWAIKEVSPVDRGAGVSTGTWSACCGSCASEIAGLPPAVDVGAVAAGKCVAKRAPKRRKLAGSPHATGACKTPKYWKPLVRRPA